MSNPKVELSVDDSRASNWRVLNVTSLVLGLFALVCVAVMYLFLLPRFFQIFSEFGTKLPALTLLIYNTSWLWVAAVLLIVMVSIKQAFVPALWSTWINFAAMLLGFIWIVVVIVAMHVPMMP